MTAGRLSWTFFVAHKLDTQGYVPSDPFLKMNKAFVVAYYYTKAYLSGDKRCLRINEDVEAIDRAEWQDGFLEVVEDLNYLFEGGVFYENNVNAWDGC